MHIEFILLAALFNYLRKFLQKNALLPKWRNLFLVGLVLSIAFLLIEVTSPGFRNVSVWIAHALTIGLIYLVFEEPALQPIRSRLYIILPLIIVNIAGDVVRLISRSYYNSISGLFETAKLFAIVWLIALVIISNKQRKNLEKERLKAEAKEKELQITEALKAQLEIQVAERTSELTQQKETLEKTILDLKATQNQLIQSEKMASLGELTAGIAHEIQNPLNFVNNFAEVNAEIIEDIRTELEAGNADEAMALADDLRSNNEKIAHHGKRADSIVKGMLQHSRKSTGVKEPTEINNLVDECLRLSYHGLRAKDKSFNAIFKSNLDPAITKIDVIPQDIGRVLLNLFNNSFYAMDEKKKELGNGYDPTLTVTTLKRPGNILIAIRDNGNGIPENIRDKIFQPFFTTKPSGKGTGLGLSMSYDIITNLHGGKISIDSKLGEYTLFEIELPV